MKVLLLGNGFDLYHKLPTKYENFLHTIDFLKNYYDESINTIGEIFGNKKIYTKDKLIAESYRLYKNVYDTINIDKDKINELIKMANQNMWFSYLLKSYDVDLQWIDFEKEIARVIKTFAVFIKYDSIIFPLGMSPFDKEHKFILEHFNYFHTSGGPHKFGETIRGSQMVTQEYQVENPYGSGNFIVNKEKLVNTLFNQLNELVDMLKMYLSYFIDEPVIEFKKHGISPSIPDIEDSEYIFTLNYTEVFEKLYKPDDVYHIHGSVGNNIVLGVNSDDSDELENLNTDFIYFKKYYQRVLYQTDSEYKKQMNNIRIFSNGVNDLEVSVIGHSLDITDTDIIKDIFNVATKICIYYHDKKVIGTYIKNLITIYGQKAFDKLRCDKELTFVQLP